MQADGLDPIAFADKDGWPAMGTFDIINMRLNGYDFHIRLMAGKASWDSPQVKKVFNTWREILPYTSEGALGRTWQEGAQQLVNKKAGMYLLGTFVGQQFTAAPTTSTSTSSPIPRQPEVGPGLDRRADRRLPDVRRRPRTRRRRSSCSLPRSPAAENIYLTSDPNDVGANKNANTSELQHRSRRSRRTLIAERSTSPSSSIATRGPTSRRP